MEDGGTTRAVDGSKPRFGSELETEDGSLEIDPGSDAPVGAFDEVWDQIGGVQSRRVKLLDSAELAGGEREPERGSLGHWNQHEMRDDGEEVQIVVAVWSGQETLSPDLHAAKGISGASLSPTSHALPPGVTGSRAREAFHRATGLTLPEDVDMPDLAAGDLGDLSTEDLRHLLAPYQDLLSGAGLGVGSVTIGPGDFHLDGALVQERDADARQRPGDRVKGQGQYHRDLEEILDEDGGAGDEEGRHRGGGDMLGVVVRPGAGLLVRGADMPAQRQVQPGSEGDGKPLVDWMTWYNESAPGEVRWSRCAHQCASRVWGKWNLQERTNGTISKVAFNWEAPTNPSFPPAMPGYDPLLLEREVWRECICVWGGPWLFSDCEIRCRGGTSLVCSVFGGSWLRRCSLGGLSSHPMDQGVNGVGAYMNARMVMDACNVTHTGFFAGVALRAHDDAFVTCRWCVFQHNEYAAGVDGCARVRLEGCLLLRQVYAAFWVGVEANKSHLSVRNSVIKGLIFQDTCLIAPNQTARQLYRYSDMYGPTHLQTGHQNTPSLYYQYSSDVRRPGVFVNESNELLEHSGEFEDFENELPEHMRFIDDYFVEDDDDDGRMWYAPDLSEEDELYDAAVEDALREEEGLRPKEFEMPDGRTITGKLNVAVDCLRQDYTLVKPHQAEAIRNLVRQRIEHEKWVAAENERRLPPVFRNDFQSKVGVDLPEWWTRYDWKNLFKKELPEWGNQDTEWDAPFRELTDADKRQIEHGQFSVQEALYSKLNLTVGGAEELVSPADFDPKTRSAFLTWPLESDKLRMRKVERRLGLPWGKEDDPRAAAAMARFRHRMERECFGDTVANIMKRESDTPPSQLQQFVLPTSTKPLGAIWLGQDGGDEEGEGRCAGGSPERGDEKGAGKEQEEEECRKAGQGGGRGDGKGGESAGGADNVRGAQGALGREKGRQGRTGDQARKGAAGAVTVGNGRGEGHRDSVFAETEGVGGGASSLQSSDGDESAWEAPRVTRSRLRPR